ncbi:hypothetical protein EKO04_008397 [Ascochyta lentis]|uniref:Metallo-beta-lactamase domain-containing protein n=1 Tax=Ascochyta lentis TaxID=205686 RepID=A0A8H7IVF6_9PLEO|nr:hypothetical protein EKO04_008397 [Ascochyta lentis]
MTASHQTPLSIVRTVSSRLTPIPAPSRAPRHERALFFGSCQQCAGLKRNASKITVPQRPLRVGAGFRSITYSTQPKLSREYSSSTKEYPSSTPHEPIIHHVFEPTTGTFQYIVTDSSSNAAVIIDPVLDFDPATATISTASADALFALVAERRYNVEYILETHAHADHLSAASYLQAKLMQSQSQTPRIGIGKRIGQVQKLFSKRYGVPAHEHTIAFDKLFDDDETFRVGSLQIQAIHLPGHTPDHMGYKTGSHVFCGDSLFHADIGTARTDFPGGSAQQLWQSGQKLLALPDETSIWTGHDYPPADRTMPVPFMTVRQHKEANKHLKSGMTEDSFVKARRERDAALAAPKLLHQSLQINVRGGKLPEPDEGGRRMLKVPLNLPGIGSW